ncbi:MAG: hypothetical protein JSV23_05620 [Promethearchaeota archaeon]|nr:MAG: hypothetical protein JSV23_05620 [Candidatus Lokiarchaeota archaeon]
MINKEFKKNWLKILNFNATRDIVEEPELVKVDVRIPLSPIIINANLLYHFFKLLYPKFINDQQNILDIIISETNKKNKVVGLYLYKTKKAGIHEIVESLPHELIRIKSVDIDKLDDLFNKAQTRIMKEKGVRISSIRLFKKEAIDLINKHCENIDIISQYQFFTRIMTLIQKFFEQDLFLIYPEPIIFKFFRESIKLLNKIQIQNLFKFIEEVLPEFNTSLLIDHSNNKVVVLLQKQIMKSGKSELSLKFFTPDDLGISVDNLDIKDSLRIIQKKLKTENTYYLNQNDIISFVSDIIELLIPLKKENIRFLLQKALYGYRSYKNHWDMVPRPIIYNGFIRFLLRLFGFNLNLKKLSHWAIPDVIINYIDFYFGLNSKVLFIITDHKKNGKAKIPQDTLLKNTIKYSFLLEFEESMLNKIRIINPEKYLANTYYNSLDLIKNTISEKFGFVSAIVIFDKSLFQIIVKNFIFGHSKSLFFPRLKTLKMLKNNKYLTVYPEFSPYKLIKRKGTISFLKLVLPVLIDKHEF